MKKINFRIWPAFSLLLLVICSVHVSAVEIERRHIVVQYDYQHMGDGFGNVRTVSVRGMMKNTADQDASIVHIQYKLFWKRRNSVSTKKLIFENIPAGEFREFQFEVDLEDKPDILEKIVVDISKIKYSTVRKSSPPSVHNVKTEETISLVKLTEEGRRFMAILNQMMIDKPFTAPVRDEFDTTDEYESDVNFAENQHFIAMMDYLEKVYGEYKGGKGAIVRFLPKNVSKRLAYLSENTLHFQIPLRLGQYNADEGRFEFLNLLPRTIQFSPRTEVVAAEIQITHRDGLFYLNKPSIDVPRETARDWRKNDDHLIVDLMLKMGVIQDGPFPKPFCMVQSIQLINNQNQKVYRRWPFKAAE